jgi:hypothetical protein
MGAEESLTGDGAGADAPGGMGAALVVGALVAGALPAFCAMAPGPGISEFGSGWAKTAGEKKISPQAARNTALNFPPYKDVRKNITTAT